MHKAKHKHSLHAGWQFRQQGTDTWLTASVPGCNFTDLHANGLIPDPFYGDNEKKLQWIENENWEYQLWFDVDMSTPSASHWQLEFDGLDTYCDVYLNDNKIASCDNMFVPLRIPCSEMLKDGRNHLYLLFHSPVKRTRPLYEKNGFTYPAENDKSEDRLSVFSRKAPYHFGWDWGPRFVTSGIWRPVHLVTSSGAAIQDVQSAVEMGSEDEASIQFDVSLDLLPEVQASTPELVVHCHNADLPEQIIPVSGSAGSFTVEIPSPQLWWPNGLTDKQEKPFLYEFELVLRSDNHQLDSMKHRIGVRSVEVINEPDEHGESFYFKVNGQPVFMKGANYIPGDSFLNRVDEAKLQQTFEDATAANMNMLRVWGGGIYQDDRFYELADEYGILIWQDFMFACTLYPCDEAFLDNVVQEAKANIKRLRNHACIALWCGNNEVEMAIEDWQWPEKFGYSSELQAKLQQDYDRLFRQVLPDLVSELDPQRFYLSSSPIGHWEHPEQDGKGNHHYWGVWHGEQPFSEYTRRIPRFMSEFGFQSFPLKQSLDQFIPEMEQSLESPTMTVHQKHPRGNGLIKKYMLEEYRPPKDFASLVYLSQVQQGRGLKQAFDAHRRHKPYCMGTLYWQFNDCWPVASWSGIDYFGRHKALHYHAKACFRPIIPVIEVHKDKIDIYVVNDTLEDQTLNLHWLLQAFDGDRFAANKVSVSVSGNESKLALSLDRYELVPDYMLDRLVFSVRLTDIEHNNVSADHAFFDANKNLALTKPEIVIELDDKNNNVLKVSSDALIKDLHVDVQGALVNFSDNFFDLLPGETKTLTMPSSPELSSMTKNELLQRVRLMSVYDTYQQEDKE